MKKIIALVVLGVISILYASPAFYLRNGPDKDTPDDVSKYLGLPSQSTDNPDGTTISLYKIEKISLLCVEYVVTFKNTLTGEDASQQAINVKRVMKQWTWRFCPREKEAEKKS